MKVLALFDKGGKIHALFHPSTEADAPQLRFHPEAGRRAEMLDVPAEFHHLNPGQLHAALRVDLAGGTPRLATQKKKQSVAQKKKRKR
jgi:hypothetical protein